MVGNSHHSLSFSGGVAAVMHVWASLKSLLPQYLLEEWQRDFKDTGSSISKMNQATVVSIWSFVLFLSVLCHELAHARIVITECFNAPSWFNYQMPVCLLDTPKEPEVFYTFGFDERTDEFVRSMILGAASVLLAYFCYQCLYPFLTAIDLFFTNVMVVYVFQFVDSLFHILPDFNLNQRIWIFACSQASFTFFKGLGVYTLTLTVLFFLGAWYNYVDTEVVQIPCDVAPWYLIVLDLALGWMWRILFVSHFVWLFFKSLTIFYPVHFPVETARFGQYPDGRIRVAALAPFRVVLNPAVLFWFSEREPLEFAADPFDCSYNYLAHFMMIPIIPLGGDRYVVPRERRKDVKKFSYSPEQSFTTRDFDYDKNCLSYSFASNRETKFFGKTVLNGKTFSFPSHGCRRSFIRFVVWMETNINFNDRARFIVEGVCTPDIWLGYRTIYNPLTAERQHAAVFEGLAPDVQNVEWACLAIGIAYHCYNKDYKSLAILLGSHASLSLKLAAHFRLDSISDLATILSDIFKRKADRSLLFAETHFDDTLRHWLCSDDDDEEAVELGPDGTISLSPYAVMSLLPDAFKKSPLVAKLVTLVTVVACASFASGNSYVPAILRGMDFSGVTEKVFCAALLTQVLTMVWTGIVNFSKSGKFLDLLGVPAETRFIRESSDLLYAVDAPLSNQQIKSNIAKAEELIRSRDYLVGTNPTIDRTVVELRKYIKAKSEFLLALEPRVEPIIIFLKGQPGSGKTTLINAIRNFLNVVDGVESFPGEFIQYNLYDKFPVESGSHCSARFLILNDIADDYTEFAKRDLAPLDITLQKAIDTCSLEFRSAAVEDKGKVFNCIKYIIVTTNHDAYKFSSDATKLKRRFASGVFVDVDFATGEFCDNKVLSDKERSAAIKFTRMAFNINRLHMTLVSTSEVFPYASFFQYVQSRVAEHFDYANLQYQKLFAPDSTCPCGVPKLMHYQDLAFISPVNPEDRSEIRPEWARISSRCVPPETSILPLSPVAFFVSGTIAAMCLPYVGGFFESLRTFYGATKRYGFEVALSAYILSGRCTNEFMRMMGARSPMMARVHEAKYRAIEFMVALYKFVRKFSRPIAMFLGTAAVGAFMYSYFNKSTDIPLGGGMSRFTVDEASMYTTVIGKPQEYQPSSLRTWARTDPVVHYELVTKGVGRDNLMTLCRNAMAMATFSYPSNGGTTCFSPRIVFLSPDYVAVNKHYFQDEKGQPLERVCVTVDGVSRNIEYCDLLPVTGSELVLVKNTWRPSTPNLMPKFANHTHTLGLSLDLLVLYQDRGNFETPAFVSETELFGQKYPSIMWKEEGTRGDCGTLAISQIKGDWFIAGIVSFGEVVRGRVVSVGVTCVDNGSFPSSVALGYPKVEEFVVPGLPRVLEPLSANSEFVQMPNKHLTPYGTSPGGNSHFKSQIIKTKLYDEVKDKFSEPYGYPDRISRMITKEDGTKEYVSAWRSTFKYVDLPNMSTESVRVAAMNAYVEDCLKPIKDTKVELHPLTLFEAFWGHESLKIEGVVMKTSLGVTWREQGFRDKHDLFVKNEISGKFEAIPEFVSCVQRLITNLENGIVQAPLVDFVPKDEVRPQAKIDACKVRLFSVLDFDINAVFRMFAMPIINYLLDNPEFSECYGAMNAGSKQWTRLAQRLQKFGFFTDLDFSSFDTSHDVIFLTLVAFFFYTISKRLGYTEDEARVLYLIMRSLSFQLLKYMCDYFGKTKGMPSGVIVTLILNSVMNSILMRMAFVVLIPDVPVSKFQDYVAPATVGDDNVSGIDASIIDRFNPVVLKPLYESWGYVITPAKKGTEFQKHIPFNDLIFLKRKFVLWSDGWYRAPLDKDSLYKALAFQGSSPLSMSQRLVNVYDSMVREAYMHGEEFFEEYYAWIREMFIRHRLAVPPGEESFPGMAKPYSFETLNQVFLEGTFVTFMC